MRPGKQSWRAFALYEVLIGLTIFVVGILALGRSVENCLHASALSSEEDAVRLILSNRMAEIQATPGAPDAKKETKIESGYGAINLIQRTRPADLKDDQTDFAGINLVTLVAEWTRQGVKQTKKLEFYVYRTT